MKEKLTLIVVALVMMLATSSFVQAEKIELTLLGMPHANNPEWNEAGIAAWKEANPQYADVEVSLVNAFTAQLDVMTAGGTPPDIVHQSSSDIPGLVYKGHLMDLGDFIKKDSSFSLASYVPSALEAGRYKNVQYGLPRAWSAVGVMYNKDLLETRGLAVPPNDWTWNDLLNTARKATFDSDGDNLPNTYGFGDAYTSHHRWPIWVWNAGGDLLNEALNVATLTDPKTEDGVRFHAGLYTEYGVAPRIVDNALVGSSLTSSASGSSIVGDLFRRGFIAFYQGSRFDRPGTDLFAYGVLPLPKGPGGDTSVMVMDFYAIHSSCKHPDIAWSLIKFLTSPDGYSVAQSPDKVYYWALSPHIRQVQQTLIPAPEEQALNWIKVAENARRPASVHPAIGIIGLDFNSVFKGIQSVHEMLITANDKYNVLLKEAWEHKPW